jgi:hypothetical protein
MFLSYSLTHCEDELRPCLKREHETITYVFNSHFHLLVLAIILQSKNATLNNCSEKPSSNTMQTLISKIPKRRTRNMKVPLIIDTT